jgi:pimeloyl-ACP methyl ester carboxylesterase
MGEKVQEATITSADGTTLVARRSGQGTPIVLVHGANGDIDTFALIEGLIAERHTVWVYSRRGRGGSSDGADYSLSREIEDVLAVLAVSGRAHLLGHSGGALYCLLAALQSGSVRSLVLYEPPLHIERADQSLADEMQAALDAGDPDRALEIFCPVADMVQEELAFLRAIEPVWTKLRAGVGLVPREIRAIQAEYQEHMPSDAPDVPTLYLYGEENRAPIFAAPDEVAELFPKAQLHGLPGQRHLAFGFDPTVFAQAVLAFTTAHDD